MATYVQYQLEDGTTVLVEVDEAKGGVVQASRAGNAIIETQTQFKAALASIKGSMAALLDELRVLEVEEASVKFGLKVIGEAGLIAVGKVGGEMNYEVTLRWKKAPPK
jgi:hypothetical protein